jgi:hypothetical protein
MNLVLVCLNNFQEYILDNINQLLLLNHKNIYIITNFNLFSHFEIFESKITLINADLLNEPSNFKNNSKLDTSFRNGFWYLTSLRFFYIYEFMNQYNVEDVIHLENDVLIYYNIEELKDKLEKKYLYIPFDSYKRNIASIMFIPDKFILKEILDNYDINENDMFNFSKIKKNTNLIKNLPIFIKTDNLNDEQLYVCENCDKLPYIFDAAAIGQYLGGIDPKNKSGNTKGFINETCVIKYNNYGIFFEEMNKVKKPFILINDCKVPIFNLHIHSKNLKEFMINTI